MIRANAASPALAALAPSGGSTAASPFFIGAAGPLLPAGNMSPWTVWSDVRTGTFSDDAAVADTKGDFAQGNIGIGVRLTGEVVAGVVATAERVSEREGGSGNALHRKMFAIGPYLAAELAPGLAFETRAQWGWSDDEMHRDSGASLFKGSREAQHGMVEARLSAERDMGDVHITADAALFYGRDTLGSALLDDGSTTQTLAGGSEELGRASLGFAAEHAFAMEGATLSPYAGARLSWDFIQPERSADALRLSTSVGMRYESGAFAATAGIDWDGVATRGLQSVAARLTVTQGF